MFSWPYKVKVYMDMYWLYVDTNWCSRFNDCYEARSITYIRRKTNTGYGEKEGEREREQYQWREGER